MPRSLFIVYTLAMGVVCAVAIALAVQAYSRTNEADAVHRDAQQWQARATMAASRDQRLVARYDAIKGMYDELVAKAQTSQARLAAEIQKTQAMHPAVITGSTIVSYATGRAPQG